MEEIDEIVEDDIQEDIEENIEEDVQEDIQEIIFTEVDSENLEVLLDIAVKLDWIFVSILAVCGLLLIHLFLVGKGDK